jgi:hypothetical protein
MRRSDSEPAVWAAGGWLLSFVALMAYWTYEESLESGQQYADPFLPCAWIAIFGALISLLIGTIVTRGWR